MSRRYSLGIDFGTSAARGLLVDVASGAPIAAAEARYDSGTDGVVLSGDPSLARQNPSDYLRAIERIVPRVLRAARRADRRFDAAQVIGIGTDATGSTPIPVDDKGLPICFQRRFARNPAALAWLWKDHTASEEAAEITALARRIRPQYVARCGGTYSSEWFFSKILHCRRAAPKVFDAAALWVEQSDWIPAMLSGTQAPKNLRVNICAAGHKGMFGREWGGYPDAEFLGRLDPALADLRARLKDSAATIEQTVGGLTHEWARRTGLRPGTPVAAGAIDAHMGAVGCGIVPGMLVKVMGTSTCDMLIAPFAGPPPEVPGLCGIVPDSIVPGCYGLEAGQSAVGDIFNWFTRRIAPGGPRAGSHESLTRAARRLAPGECGLLALDWNNGNRCVLVDPRLSGLLIGHTLRTAPAEIYRALIEATAFGALRIIEQVERCGLRVRRIMNVGGIAEKSPLVMQIYADVLGRPMAVARGQNACALGAAIAGAVAAGKSAGGYATVAAAQRIMATRSAREYRPSATAHSVYSRLYRLYGRLHDAFGTRGQPADLFEVMKELLVIRESAAGRKGRTAD